MPRKPKPPLEVRVPAALERLGRATPAELLAHLGGLDYAGRARVYRLLWEMVDAGRAATVPGHPAAGFFYVAPAPEGGDLQAKLRRAVRLRHRKYGNFTLNDLAGLAQARSRDYVKRLVRFWEGLALVLDAEGRGRERVYQLAPGVQAEHLPHWHRRGEEARKRGQGSGARGQEKPCAACQAQAAGRAKVRGVLGEMEEALGRCLGHGQQVQELLGKMKRALGEQEGEP